MAWNNNKNVLQTFCSNDTQNAWANIQDLGWKKIKPNAADGVTNLFVMLNAAKANGRLVHVLIEDATQQITQTYLN